MAEAVFGDAFPPTSTIAKPSNFVFPSGSRFSDLFVYAPGGSCGRVISDVRYISDGRDFRVALKVLVGYAPGDEDVAG